MTPEQVAHVCHEANRALTIILQDIPLQSHWKDAPEEMKRSSIQGVAWRIENPTLPASAQHEKWLSDKARDGWTHGPTKDSEKKEHPAMVPFEELPEGVKLKDKVFTAIVLALTFP